MSKAMPRTDPVLASSPAELPKPQRDPIKRSHSAASLASLPTPPRTRKRKRSRSRHSRATDSDLDASDDEEAAKGKPGRKGVLFVGNKKRKMLRVDALAAELSGQAAEDAFWLGESATTATAETSEAKGKGRSAARESTSKETRGRSRSRTRSPTRSPSSSPPARLLTRNRTGLLSPPKSHRRRSPRHKLPFDVPETIAEEPATPSTKSALDGVKKKLFPERDSPNNPFLVSEGSSISGSQESPKSEPVAGCSSTPSLPRTPKKKYIEKPTITYVFRGVRQEFVNPLYDPSHPETGVPPSRPDSPSNLAPDDPNFSPKEYCPPRILFPEARTRRRRRADPDSEDDEAAPALAPVPVTPKGKGKPQGKKPRVLPAKPVRSEWDTSEEEDNAELPVTPTKAPAPVTPPRRRAAAVQPPERRRVVIKTMEQVLDDAPRTRSRTRAETTKAVPAAVEIGRAEVAKRATGTRGRPTTRR